MFDQEADATDEDPEQAEEPGFFESVLVADDVDEVDDTVETSDDLTAVVRAVRESTGEVSSTQPSEAEPTEAASADERADKQRRRNGKRASVPSWDEIMFGRGGDH